MRMSESIHGHEVMRMMLADGQIYTNASLEQAIIKRFGEKARFHTCSAENMTPKEIVSFLESRGKFIREPGGFRTRQENICDH